VITIGDRNADPILPLVRRWAVQWLNGHDASVCDEILAEDYSLVIGGFSFNDRRSYVQATWGQIALFPGLTVTVHDVVTNGRQVAVHLTEHGASIQHDGAAAAWNVIALFEGANGWLQRTFAEEDYLARKRQLAGSPDRVATPAVAPWDVPAFPTNEGAEGVVRAWVTAGAPDVEAVVRDDELLVGVYEQVMRASSGELDLVLSAGDRVAFHGMLRGASVADDVPCTMAAAGILDVRDGRIVSGRIVTDRLGCQRSLRVAAR